MQNLESKLNNEIGMTRVAVPLKVPQRREDPISPDLPTINPTTKAGSSNSTSNKEARASSCNKIKS